MPKTVRSYVSRHVYQTPTGLWYDDRTGRRLTARRGASAGRANERMKARYKDESGRLTFKNHNVTTDAESRSEPSKRYYERPAVVASAYDPSINPELAEKNIIKHLNEDEPEYRHFNIEISPSEDEEMVITE